MRESLFLLLLAGRIAFGADAASELLRYENAVCRVVADDAVGTSHGSGVLVDPPASHAACEYVLTCYHVIREAYAGNREIDVTWDGTTFYPCKVVGGREYEDVAVLKVLKKVPDSIPRVPIYTDPLQIGDTLVSMGFGATSESPDANTLRRVRGRVTKFVGTGASMCWFSMEGISRMGDSGGPALIERGDKVYLVGTVWGSSSVENSMVGTRPRVLRRLFAMEQYPNVTPRPVRTTRRVRSVGPT